jgi:Histidine kinase-like ATPase domain
VARHDRQTMPGTPRRLNFSIRATRKAAATARRALTALELPLPLANDAQLAVSELATNSVRHAGLALDDLIRITVDWSGARLRVHVRDGGPGMRPGVVLGSIRPALGRSRDGACTWWTVWPAGGVPVPTGTGLSSDRIRLVGASSCADPPRPRPPPGPPLAWPPRCSGRSLTPPAPRQASRGSPTTANWRGSARTASYSASVMAMTRSQSTDLHSHRTRM